MDYSRRILNFVKRIALFDMTHMMSMANPVAISVDKSMIDSGCSLEKN